MNTNDMTKSNDLLGSPSISILSLAPGRSKGTMGSRLARDPVAMTVPVVFKAFTVSPLSPVKRMVDGSSGQSAWAAPM